MNYMEEVFAPILARYREDVRQEIWGHAAPLKNKSYSGRVVYAVGCCGNDDLNPIILLFCFDGLDLSPWIFDALTEFMQANQNEPGVVYELVGTFRNYVFDFIRTVVYQAQVSA